ncbi:transcription termination/antitermination protein NusG [Aquibaculum arenosum]|uniref:Transcription termination/antitermination NusG family protein n=1 Tax=Aquibaculum arenosum TaxID=3032591 RepID=A0ABT5YLT3_9PROT|nr:transcription termination/antitermination NusG family protein [Fodinicurvata sp. CAU 1616]MDF2095808.1 transcription termination/antitermination NusG family protein [Fodinicurvata sp. CAU 1616]
MKREQVEGRGGWYCVHSQVGKEALALRHLQQQTFEAFLPLLARTRRHARRTDTVLAPLFPSYLFVHLDPQRQAWRSVNGTIGVVRLLSSGERPLRVPPGVVEALLAASDRRGLLQAERLERLQVDDDVRILVGPFADHLARVVRLEPAGRVRVLLEFLGGRVPVTLPLNAVRKSA